MNKVLVFDLGGTLMQYKGMPLSWLSYYKDCFESVNDHFNLRLKTSEILESTEILKGYNPRYKPRELEYPSEVLFREATKHWKFSIPIEEILICRNQEQFNYNQDYTITSLTDILSLDPTNWI